MNKLLLSLFPFSLFAFVVDPYLTPIAEFEFRPSYSYRYYPSVDHGENPSSYHSHDQLIDLNLGVNFWPNWDFQFQADFSHTHKLNWGGQRVGTQLRYLLWNDVVGDPISLTIGGQIFYVPTHNMRDVSSPYHSQGNFELGIAAGNGYGVFGGLLGLALPIGGTHGFAPSFLRKESSNSATNSNSLPRGILDLVITPALTLTILMGTLRYSIDRLILGSIILISLKFGVRLRCNTPFGFTPTLSRNMPAFSQLNIAFRSHYSNHKATAFAYFLQWLIEMRI